MAIIYSYPLNRPKRDDLLIGTITYDEDAVNPVHGNPTVSFTIGSLLDLVSGQGNIQNLQQVTNIGNTTTNSIIVSNSLKVSGGYYDSSNQPGSSGQVLSSTVTGTQWVNVAVGGVTSVAQSHEGNAFSVTGSPITSAGTLAIEMEGSALQYINGLGNLVLLSTLPQGAVTSLTTTGTSGASTLTSGVLNIPNYANTQNTLTTIGTSGDATLVGEVLNIPNYTYTYTLPVATDTDLGGVKIGYTTDATARNYAVTLDTEQMFVNVPWTDTPYVLPLAADGTRGGVQIGYTQTATRDYPVTLDSEKMLVTVPWTDTPPNPFQTITGTGSDNTDSGILLSDSGGTVLILGDGSVTAAQTGNTITLTGTDTGITGVTLAIADSAGEPLLRTITNRELTLTSAKYVGGANVGYVPEGGTGTTYLKGDGTWEAIPTGLIFKGTWDARNIAEGGASDGGDPDLDGIAGAADGWLYIVSVAGSAVPNGAATTPNSWNLGDWCVYDGTNWTRVPSTNAGVTTVDTTNGTYMDLTPVTATGGNVVITADLSAVDASGAVPDDSLFLRKDNKWSTAITEVAPLFGQSPNYGGIIISPAVTTATYLNDENVTSSVTLTLTAVNAAIEVGDIISGVGITVGTEVDAISVSGLVITMSNSNIIAENQTLVYTKATSNANLASVSLDYYGGNNMILAAEPEPVDNTTNPPTPIYPNYTTDEMLWTQASSGAAKNVYRSRLENFPFAPITASGTVKSVTGLSIITTNGSGKGGGIEVTGSINVDPIVSVKYDLPTVIGTDTRWNIIDAAAPAGGFSNINDSILVLQTQGGGMGTVGKQPLSKLPFYDNVFAPATEFIRTDNQQVTNSVTIVFNNSTATIEQGMQVSFVGMVGTPTVSSVTTNPNFSIILTGSNQSINAGTSITFKGIGEIGVVPAPTIATLADQDGYFLNSNADWGVALTEVLPLVGNDPRYGGIVVDPSITTSTYFNNASTTSVTLVLTVANSAIGVGWVITGDDIDSSSADITVTGITGNTLTLSVAQTIAEDATLFYTKPTTSSGTTSLSVDYLGGFNVVSAAYAQSGPYYAGGSWSSANKADPDNQVLVYNKDLSVRRVEAVDLRDLPFAPYTASGSVTGVLGFPTSNDGLGGGVFASASATQPIVRAFYDKPVLPISNPYLRNIIAAAPFVTRDCNLDCKILVLEDDGSQAGAVQSHKLSDLPFGNGTVIRVRGTGTKSGLTLTGDITGDGYLTLGGTLSLTSANVTDGLGFTPYNDTNPAGYTNNTGTVTSVGTTAVAVGAGGLIASPSSITGAGTIGVNYGTGAGGSNIITNAFADAINVAPLADADLFIRHSSTLNYRKVIKTSFSALKTYIASGAPSGTVTSVGSGDGLTGGAITGTGTLTVDYTNSTSNLINNPTILTSTISVPDADSILILKTTGSPSAIGSVQRTAISNLPFTNNAGTITSVAVTAGTGITASVANSTSTPNITITNSAPNIVQTTITGNAGSATVLQTARTIAGVSFNGSANISLNNNAITNGAGYITSYVNTTYTAGSGLSLTGTVFANTAPNIVQTTVSGSSGSCTGNAASATILQNARNIAGVSFNGSANISLNNNAITNGAGYTTNTGTVTSSSATANRIPKFSSTTNVTNSAMNDTGTGIALTSTSGNYGFTVTDGSGFKHTVATSAQIGFHAQYTGGAAGTLFRGTYGASTTVFNVTTGGIVTAAGDIVALSDQRLKSNIETLDGSKVYKMRGVSFDKDGKKGSGVIAQEMEKIAPELVNNDNEYKAVAYGNISGYLIEAIKELKQEIEELKNKPCNCNCK